MSNTLPLPTFTAKQIARYWSNVDKSDTCWDWQGWIANGYGRFQVGKHAYGAHRMALLFVGDDPGDLYVDHICFNTKCVNPDHLRAVTQKQNMEHQRGAHKRSKTGVRGVYRVEYGRFRARVTHQGNTFTLGRFARIEDAEAAVKRARAELFTHDDAR